MSCTDDDDSTTTGSYDNSSSSSFFGNDDSTSSASTEIATGPRHSGKKVVTKAKAMPEKHKTFPKASVAVEIRSVNVLCAVEGAAREDLAAAEEHAMSVLQHELLKSVKRMTLPWYHRHVRTSAALALQLVVSTAPTHTDPETGEEGLPCPLLHPFADCVDALLRVMVLVACGSRNNNLACFSTRPGRELELTYEFNPSHVRGEGIHNLGDPRCVAYVLYQGQQAIAILEDSFKQIRVVSVFSWSNVLTRISLPDDGLVHTVVALADMKRVAVSNCTSKRAVFIIDIDSGVCERTIRLKRSRDWWPTGLCALPDGRVAVAEYEGGLEILDPDDGRCVQSVKLSKTARANKYKEGAEVPDYWEFIDTSDLMGEDNIRPSRIALLPRRVRYDDNFGTSESDAALRRSRETTEIVYDLLLLDDDYARCVTRVSYPDYKPVGLAPHINISHLYQSECGAIWPLPEHAPAFYERLAVLNHGGDGAIHLVHCSDSRGTSVTKYVDKNVLSYPLGMTMVPEPDYCV